MAMFAASPNRIIEAAFGARPTGVDFIILDGEAAKIAIPTHTRSETYLIKATYLKFGNMYCDLVQM